MDEADSSNNEEISINEEHKQDLPAGSPLRLAHPPDAQNQPQQDQEQPMEEEEKQNEQILDENDELEEEVQQGADQIENEVEAEEEQAEEEQLQEQQNVQLQGQGHPQPEQQHVQELQEQQKENVQQQEQPKLKSQQHLEQQQMEAEPAVEHVEQQPHQHVEAQEEGLEEEEQADQLQQQDAEQLQQQEQLQQEQAEQQLEQVEQQQVQNLNQHQHNIVVPQQQPSINMHPATNQQQTIAHHPVNQPIVEEHPAAIEQEDGEEIEAEVAQAQAHQQLVPQLPDPTLKLRQEQAAIQAAHQLHKMQQQEQNKRTQSYIHHLQRQLQSSRQLTTKQSAQLISARQAQAKLRAEFESSKQTNMDLRKKKLEVEVERTRTAKDYDRLKKEHEAQQLKLQQLQTLGDLFALKQANEQLQLLTETQQQEIIALNNVAPAQPSQEQQQQQQKLIQNYEAMQEKLQAEIQTLQNENCQLAQNHQKSQQQIQTIEHSMQNQTQTISALENERESLKNSIQEWQTKWAEFETERETNRKARQLQKKVYDYESERNIVGENQLLHLNVLTDREEKQLILRQYLALESKHAQLSCQLEQNKVRLRKLEKEQSRIHSNFVKKKEYIDLSAKYLKAKRCLEGTFQQLRSLSNAEQPATVQEEVNELLEGIEGRTAQNFIRNTQSSVAALHQRVDSLDHAAALATLTHQHTQLSHTHSALRREQQHNERILSLMNDDIVLKNRLINQKNEIIDRLRQRELLSLEEGEQRRRSQKLQNEMLGLKETLSVFQTQNIMLAKEISSLNGQVAHWRELYSRIKESLAQKISSSLQFRPAEPGQQGQLVAEDTRCRQCETRRATLLQKEQQSVQIQTQCFNEFYYREIKEYLHFLKKISKELDAIPVLAKELHKHLGDIRDKFATEFKEKYDKAQAVVNGKLAELKREKADNDSWRVRAKEEMREEFQDVRELVMNQRLANALRQAKNLIDYLEDAAAKLEQENNAQEENNGQDEMEEEVPEEVQKEDNQPNP